MQKLTRSKVAKAWLPPDYKSGIVDAQRMPGTWHRFYTFSRSRTLCHLSPQHAKVILYQK